MKIKKYIKLPLFFALIAGLTLATFGCDKDDDEPTITCDQATTKLTETGLAFLGDSGNKSKCEAYKAAIQQIA
jgi:hypothetical protein